MEGYVVEWLSLLGRWVHLVTGIAWIGASFYFVWLDNSLETPKHAADTERGVGGEIWSVHGGGFYHAQKYKVAPPTLPETLHWFKWEAYTTWITGMFLISLLYWYQAEIYLIDPSVMAMSKPVAVILGMLTLVAGWIAYDQLCKSPLGTQEGKLSAAMLVFVSIVAWGLCQIFSGRGAYLHFGAMLGTIMVANVFFVIMPGQRDLVAAKAEGRAPDPMHGIRAKQRSVHNTFFTLPVLFVMISNHYAMTWGHKYNWLILIALSVAGAAIRVYFVQRHRGKASPIPLVVAAVLIMGTAAAIVPRPNTSANVDSTASPAEVFADVQGVMEARCTSCRAQSPTQPGFSAPPKGIVLESADDIVRQAQTIHQQVVVTKAMPIGNLTQITDEERALIDQWFQSGGKIRMSNSSYYAPQGGLPAQTELLTDRAMVTEAYTVIPKGVLRDIVTSFLPFWTDTRAWILARPIAGFSTTFSHYIMEVSPGGGSDKPELESQVQGVMFVVEGSIEITVDGQVHTLEPGGYAYLPAGAHWSAHNRSKSAARFHWIRKAYETVDGIDQPEAFITSDKQVEPTAMPDTDGRWATTRFVDPADLRHDMHVTIVTLAPGAVIPFLETHVMEHGLYVLEGKGVYRLNQDWVEVEAGDYMWLRAFCPQACYAGGPGAFRYLLYKDVNRHMKLT